MSFLFTIVVALNNISFSFSYASFGFQLTCMHNRQFHNKAKLILHLILYVMPLNSSFRFIDISWLIFLTNIEHSLPISLVAENMSSVKVSLFKIQNSWTVFSLLFLFLNFITFSQGFALVTLNVWIKYPKVEEYSLSSNSTVLALSDWFSLISSPDNSFKAG